MGRRSIREMVEDLRIILQKFEHSPDADYDESALVELKRILFDRIAELEAERATNKKATPVTSSVEPQRQITLL